MNISKTFLVAAAAAVLIGATAGAWAQTGHNGMGHAADPSALTDGEIRKIDLEQGKLTLKHGDIRNLDMPGMTMVFNVGDKRLLEKLKVGDRVRFAVVMDKGKMVITEIRVVK